MGAITQIASALVNCATNEVDVRLAMQSACTLILHLRLSLSCAFGVADASPTKDNHEWNAYVMGTLAATCELQESINECYQPPEKNPASCTSARTFSCPVGAVFSLATMGV